MLNVLHYRLIAVDSILAHVYRSAEKNQTSKEGKRSLFEAAGGKTFPLKTCASNVSFVESRVAI